MVGDYLKTTKVVLYSSLKILGPHRFRLLTDGLACVSRLIDGHVKIDHNSFANTNEQIHDAVEALISEVSAEPVMALA